MKQSSKVFPLISLATKAGKTVSGEFSTEKAIKEGRAAVAIVAVDASENTKKMFRNMCTYYKVPLYFFGDKGELGHAMGKEMRASLAVIDEGLGRAIVEKLKNEVE